MSSSRSWCWFSRSLHCPVNAWTFSTNVDTMSDKFRSKSFIVSCANVARTHVYTQQQYNTYKRLD